MSSQVSLVCNTCIGLRRLQKLVPLLSFNTLRTAVSATVLSRLYYGNAVYLGLPLALRHKLQVVMNNTAHLISNSPTGTRVTPLLHDLHWLPIAQRIHFKMLCLVFKALNSAAPAFVARQLGRYIPGSFLIVSAASDPPQT